MDGVYLRQSSKKERVLVPYKTLDRKQDPATRSEAGRVDLGGRGRWITRRMLKKEHAGDMALSSGCTSKKLT